MAIVRKLGKACLAVKILVASITPSSCHLEAPLTKPHSHTSSHRCECTPFYGRGLQGDEFPLVKGCGEGPSCSEACDGNFTWKESYRQARANESALLRSWLRDNQAPTPAKKWPLPPNKARFAIMFSGEIRNNFIATFFTWTSNVVHPSGGYVHMFFDVWYNPRNPLSGVARDLARSHPNTKAYIEETFQEHDAKLRAEHPWLYQGFSRDRDEARALKGHYGQMRKMWRAYKLVQASGVPYTLVVRGRPDAAILQPLDLRALHIEMSRHPSVRRARGHYIAIPERDPFVQISDIFAIGTMESIAAFASPLTAFSQLMNEAHVERNLVWHGFARTDTVLAEELVHPRRESRTVSNRLKQQQELEANDPSNATSWQLMNPSFRRGNFSALMSTSIAFQPLGDRSCVLEGAACVPVYRIRFTSILYTALKPWFSVGAFCLPTTSFFAKQVSEFLVAANIGTLIKSNLTGAASRTDDLRLGYHCLNIPSLSRALSNSMAFACYCFGDSNSNRRLNCHVRDRGNQSHTRASSNRFGSIISEALFWDERQWDSMAIID